MITIQTQQRVRALIRMFCQQGEDGGMAVETLAAAL
jgi:hypothetical protein